MLTEWIVRKLSQVCDKTPEGSRLRGRPKADGEIVYKHLESVSSPLYTLGKRM